MNDEPLYPPDESLPPARERVVTYRVTDADGGTTEVEAMAAMTLESKGSVPGPLVLYAADGRPAALFAPGHWVSCVAES